MTIVNTLTRPPGQGLSSSLSWHPGSYNACRSGGQLDLLRFDDLLVERPADLAEESARLRDALALWTTIPLLSNVAAAVATAGSSSSWRSWSLRIGFGSVLVPTDAHDRRLNPPPREARGR